MFTLPSLKMNLPRSRLSMSNGINLAQIFGVQVHICPGFFNR